MAQSIADRRSGCQAGPARARTQTSRRSLLAPILLAPVLMLVQNPRADARPVNTEVAAADSPMIQGMLRQTEAMRDQRAKERLDWYNRRNFKEYFDYEMGPGSSGRISADTKEAIKKWLADNP